MQASCVAPRSLMQVILAEKFKFTVKINNDIKYKTQ